MKVHHMITVHARPRRTDGQMNIMAINSVEIRSNASRINSMCYVCPVF